MNTRPIFTFPGLWPYIARAAEGRDLPHLGQGRSLWHSKQVQDALGQLPALDAESRRELLAHVRGVRDALAAAVEGIDLAVRETIEAVEGEPEGASAPASDLAASTSLQPEPQRAASSRRKRV
ncbi:hypothetical protein [Planctomyces sp. SH-PL62]|uniref:hypothetical protein n=1 Tax=Planctomyces sp. SH-PL62 TaxID=1636152 RepID=UPI00078CCC65|nr:hypothetical protein [Planctomyces sp. SH-PL62]AMV37359.1 hypothetical protein VT85_07990 [Planctomyces sp. SH-PL62]